MRDGFNLGTRVMPRVRGPEWIEGTLAAGKNDFGWVNPAYNGEGFYFVRWDGNEKIYVVREDDIEISEVIRYVVTNLMGLPPDGAPVRTLTFPAQGRYTYATHADAQAQLDLFKPGLRQKILGDRADTLEVRPCKCWPGHFDPRGIYFDLENET